MAQTQNETTGRQTWTNVGWPDRIFAYATSTDGRVCFSQSSPDPVATELTYSDCAHIVDAFYTFCREKVLPPSGDLATNLMRTLQHQGRNNLWTD